MNQREAADLDRYITGSWGEDQIEPDDDDPRIAAAERVAKALEECLKDTFTASDGMSECGNLYPKRRYRAGTAALAAWNALK